MFQSQLEQIQSKKQKAFSIFHKTKNSLLNTIEQAKTHIDEISASINQIDTIIGAGK